MFSRSTANNRIILADHVSWQLSRHSSHKYSINSEPVFEEHPAQLNNLIGTNRTISRSNLNLRTNLFFRRIAEALCGGWGDDSLSFSSAYRGERTIERGRARSSKRGEYATRLSRRTSSQISPGAPRHRFTQAYRQFHVSIVHQFFAVFVSSF